MIGQESVGMNLYAYAMEESTELIKVDKSGIEKLYQDCQHSKDDLDFQEFLSESIPGFKQKITSQKAKIMKFLKRATFVPG